MNARDAFKNNLPEFVVESVRGNVVADADDFTSKGGRDFVSFKIAHSFSKEGVTAFIKVLKENGKDYPKKGDYVEVAGTYTESENESDDGTTYLNRTIFAKAITILGSASENGKAAPKTKSKGKR